MKFMYRTLFVAASLLAPLSVSADALTDAVNHAERSGEQRLRDEYRHPQQTLRFFDVQEDMQVVEVSPGGGWYTHILAPLLHDKGQLYAAHFYIDEDTGNYFRNVRAAFEKKVAELPGHSKVKITDFHPSKALNIAPAGSVDRVLTFRNVHNWYMQEGDKTVDNVFAAFFTALKKGGILGVVEHRLPESADDAMQQRSGYMKQSYVIAAAERAGFRLLESSEVNANPADTADHPRGVWTLPPVMRLGEQDEAKYRAIGESDRMTLKFIKP